MHTVIKRGMRHSQGEDEHGHHAEQKAQSEGRSDHLDESQGNLMDEGEN